MNIISFVEDPTVVRKILKHLGIWEINARPPPTKNISPWTGEPIPEECLPWTAETMYDNVDQIYKDYIVSYGLPQPRSSWSRYTFAAPSPAKGAEYVLSQPLQCLPLSHGHYFKERLLHRSAFAFRLVARTPFNPSAQIPPVIRPCFYCNSLQYLWAREIRRIPCLTIL
jgi:hypothetical protein